MGSSKTPSSDQSLSFSRLGRPANKSNTLPTMVFCLSLSLTPEACLMSVLSMFRFPDMVLAVVEKYLGAVVNCLEEVFRIVLATE